MNEAFQVIFGLLGGLSIFLFGMNMMSESLQKAAGEKMKKMHSGLPENIRNFPWCRSSKDFREKTKGMDFISHCFGG